MSNTIFALRMLGKNAAEHQQDLFLCFIDYQEAFDKVRHKELFKMLANIQIDDTDMQIVRSVIVISLVPFAFRTGQQTGSWSKQESAKDA